MQSAEKRQLWKKWKWSFNHFIHSRVRLRKEHANKYNADYTIITADAMNKIHVGTHGLLLYLVGHGLITLVLINWLSFTCAFIHYREVISAWTIIVVSLTHHWY